MACDNCGAPVLQEEAIVLPNGTVLCEVCYANIEDTN